MKILHVFDHSLPIQDGYSFRSISILKQQEKMGWDTVQLTGPNQLGRAGVERIEGIAFDRTNRLSGWTRFLPVIGNIILVHKLAASIDKLVKRHQPDIIHAHSPALNGLAALWVCRKYRLPLVYEIRAYWEDAAVEQGKTAVGSIRYRLTRFLEDFVAQRAAGIVTICKGIQDDLFNRIQRAKSTAVVPNSIELGKFEVGEETRNALRRKFDVEDKVVIGFIGTFNNYEGLDMLVKVAPDVLEAIPNAMVMLVGGGPEEQALRELAAELPDKLVVFAGRVSAHEVAAYYSLMDVLVYPRYSTRLTEMVTPLKPLEAMAARKLVVASSIGGHRELITHGTTGYLFEAGMPSSLMSTLMEALESGEFGVAMADSGYEFVRNRRTIEAAVREYEQLYEAIMDDHRL